MNQDDRVKEQLLIKYLLEETSAEENEVVKQWLAANKANQHYFDNLQLLWDAARAERPATQDISQAWLQTRQKIAARQTSKRRVLFPRKTLMKVAAILLLGIGAYSCFIYISSRITDHEVVQPVAEEQPVHNAPPDVNTQGQQNDDGNIATTASETKLQPVANISENKTDDIIETPTTANRSLAEDTHRKKELICNSTPCSIEICIVQSVKCEGNSRDIYAYCSVLEPDESGMLHYKAFDNAAQYCEAAVEEVRIKRLSTGETIVLNAHTSPATAQDFFNYITGKKKGGIEAGMFEADCDNICMSQSLTLDNTYGNAVLQ